MPRPPAQHPAIRWVVDHDDRLSFVVPYLILSIVLGVFVSLFWLFALILLHGAFEWIRQRRVDPRPGLVLGRIAWELKLDVALLLFALVIVVYTDVVLGLLGLSAAARAGGASAARIVAWQRGIRGFLLTVDEMAIAARSAARLRGRGDRDDPGTPAGDEDTADRDAPPPSGRGSSAPEHQPLPVERLQPWKMKWGRGDALSVLLVALMAALLVLAPIIHEATVHELWLALLEELQPFP